MKKLLLVVFALAGNASAATITFTSVTGNWHDATATSTGTQTGSPVITNASPTSSVNWGGGSPQSGYDFTRAIPGAQVLPPAPTPFFTMGTFTHRNFPVNPPSLTSIKLDVVLSLTVDGVTTAPMPFTFEFTHFETPNNTQPCPYPTPAGEGCTDKVAFVSGPNPTTFNVGGVDYTLAMYFADSNNNPETEFITREKLANTSNLIGQFTVAPPPTNPPPTTPVLTSIRVSPQVASLNTNAHEQFIATALDQFGNAMTLTTPFAWGNDNTPGNVINTSGLYQAGNNVGSDVVRATNQGVQGIALVTISSVTVPPTPPNQTPALTSIRITPKVATVRTNLQIQFNAAAYDQYNNIMTLTTPFVWSNTNNPPNSIDQSGLYLAGPTVGNDTVKVTNQGLQDTAAITITTAPPGNPPTPGHRHLRISPHNPPPMHPGEIKNFTVVSVDQQGVESPITPTWSVGGGAGTMSSAGAFTASNIAPTALLTASAPSNDPDSVTVSIIAADGFGDITTAHPYPVPWKSTSGIPYITFGGLAPSTRIRLFTPDGRKVVELSSVLGEKVLWDIKNMRSEGVSSGVYLYIIDNASTHQTVKGKLVVIQ